MHRLSILTVGILSLLAPAAGSQSMTSPAARVFGAAVECRNFDAHEPATCAVGLLRYVRSKVRDEFIVRNGLEATTVELERLTDYNRAFERHDRAQRSRKLAELEARLSDASLQPGERARLEEFRAVLLRLARYEADVDGGVEAREPIDEKTLRRWIETVKLNAALYAKYGGSIGVAAYGPYAHGAMRALIVEHMARGDVHILDTAVAQRFATALDAPPRLPHTHGEPDFTPFWERPIEPSYLPY